MPIRAILWDVDDTIFDYRTADRTGMRAHLRDEGLLDAFHSVEQALSLWHETTEIHWARFAAKETDFLGQRRDRVRAFLQEPMSDAAADAWFGRYIRHYEAAWALFPDTVPALDALAAACRHGVLSNSHSANQERKLRALGLRDRFEVLLCANDLGCSKPAARAFLAGCRALGLPPAEVAYVGDKLDIDALGARDAGLHAVWVDRADTESDLPEGVMRVESLCDLPELLWRLIGFGAPSPIG